jgi:acyl-CoA thioester hydrolase
MPDTATDSDYRLALRVYWEDTDAGGVVFYANYLKFFERARTEWLRSLGHRQEKLRAEEGLMFVVTDTAVRYLRPARLDDALDVTVRLEHAARARLTLFQQAWRRGEDGDGPALLAEGTIRLGCVDAGTFRPQRIPNSVLAAIGSPFAAPEADAGNEDAGRLARGAA